MLYNSEPYAYLFTEDAQGIDAVFLRPNEVGLYCVKTIKSGPRVKELEIYPLLRSWPGVQRIRTGETSEAQKSLNARNAVKRFMRLANANFDEHDLHVTLTYAGSLADATLELAQRDVRNYLRRIAYWRKTHGLPRMRYMYVHEYRPDAEDESAEDADRPVRLHHHILMTGMDRDAAEAAWSKGFANADRLQPNEDGIKGLSLYLLKNPCGRKRWGWSKNLIQPTITLSKKKISKRQAARIAADVEIDGKAIIENCYPGYLVQDVDVRRSDYLAGCYIYVQLRSWKQSDNRTPKKRAHTCARAHARDGPLLE